MSNNYAEYFPILKYQNGVLTRVNGNGGIIGGKYAIFPLLSTSQQPFLELDNTYSVFIDGSNERVKVNALSIQFSKNCGLPDPCFLVATRYYSGYSIEELEDLNKIWNDLMSKL
jgi:hypothetical protein